MENFPNIHFPNKEQQSYFWLCAKPQNAKNKDWSTAGYDKAVVCIQ